MKKLQTLSLLLAVLMLGILLSGCDRILVPENRSELLPSSERWPREVVPSVSAERVDVPTVSVSDGVLWVVRMSGAGWTNLACPLPAWHHHVLEASMSAFRLSSSQVREDRMRLGMQE